MAVWQKRPVPAELIERSARLLPSRVPRAPSRRLETPRGGQDPAVYREEFLVRQGTRVRGGDLRQDRTLALRVADGAAAGGALRLACSQAESGSLVQQGDDAPVEGVDATTDAAQLR